MAAEFVREVNSKAWDQARWAEVIPQRGTKLTTDQSLKIIGEMYDVMKSNICIDILARFLEQRHILNTEQSNFFIFQAAYDPDHETRRFTQFVMVLKRIATIPTAGCVKSLYLSLLDSYERERQYSTRTEGHMIIAGYLRELVQVVLNIRDDDDSSQIERCINDLPEHAVTFELAKASTLAQNLGIAGIDGSNNFWSYKEVCKLWLNNNSGDQCTLSQLVCALFKSGLARLCCGLRPIYESNQSQFKSFIHESVKSQSQFRRMVKFFGYEREGQSIESEFKGMTEIQARLLLRLLLIPNCGDDEIDNVIKCLVVCLKMSERQPDSKDQPSVACEQPSETEAKVVSHSHVTKDLPHDHDGSATLTLVDKAQGPTKVNNPGYCSPSKVSSTGRPEHLVQGYRTDALFQDPAQDFIDPFTLLEECCNGYWDTVNAMLLTQDNMHCLRIVLDASDASGKTPLHHACMSGNYEIVVLMIQKKANLSHVDHRGNCILHYSAVLRNEDLLLAVLTAFVHAGISTDIPTKDENHTPLMVACTLRGPEVARAVELLLTHGASPDGHTMAISRPIIVACEQGSLELVKLLDDYSADVNAQDKDSNTALLKACLQKCWRIVKYLLGLKDININRSDRSGTTPLFAAVSANNQEITQLLLQKKARVNSVRAVSNEYIIGHVEETPLAHACARGFLEIVQLLLMANADINFKCSDTVPAIGFAIICRQDHIVQYLLTHPRLDKSIGGLSSAIIISVKVGNATCTKLILSEFGGAEKCLRLAEENDLPELQNHIHEYIVTSGPESGMQEKAPEPIEDFTVHSQGQARRFSQSSAAQSMPLKFHHTQQRAKVEEVLQQFCEICVKVVTKTISYSQLADITRELHSDLSSFFRRCANDNEDSQMLRSDFLGASTGMSPLSFLIQQKSLNSAIFQHGANSYFNNEPGEFYQRLISAFHTIPGGEDLPWNVDDVLERLFSQQFSINVFSQRRGEFDHLPDRHGTCGSGEHLLPDWKPQPCSKPNQKEMFVQGDSERFEAEGRVESLASDTWTKDKETVREERVNTKILKTSEDVTRAVPIIQPNKNQRSRQLRQHQELDNSGHEIHVIGAYRMDDQGLKGTKQRQKPHTSMGTHNGVRQQNSRTGSLATGASAHHQSPTLTGEGENGTEFSDSESVVTVIGKESNEDIKESKRQQLNYYARSRGDNNEINSLSLRLSTPLPEEDSQDETESLSQSATALSDRDGNSHSRVVAGNSSSKCADWLETSRRPSQTKPITANSGGQLHRSLDSMQGLQSIAECPTPALHHSVVDTEPTLAKLSLLKSTDGKKIRIIKRVAPSWRNLGILLDFDSRGTELAIIDKKHHGDPESCCQAMFQCWLNGNGRGPYTWRTLIELIKDCDMEVLAIEVENFIHTDHSQ